MKLREEHAQLVEIVRRLGTFIDQPLPPYRLDLFDLRRELNSVLIAHLKSEDWVLYPRLIASGDPQVAAVAKTFSDEMGWLAPAFMAYNDKWCADSIDRDWAGYCSETREIIEVLAQRITRENRDLYPLLDRLNKAA